MRRLTRILAAAIALALIAPASALGFGFITSWGSGGSGPGQFGEAADVAVDGAFDVYVADRFNDRVQVFSPLGAFKRAWPLLDESFGVDVAGNEVFVTEFNDDGVSRFTTQGAFLGRWGTSGTRLDPQPRYREPFAVDVGPDGDVYVADSINGRVVVTTQAGAFVREMGVGLLTGLPFGVAAASGGSAWVADTGNDRIVRVDPGGTFHVIGGPGTGPVQFDFPMDLAFDPSGDLLVLDRFNDRVQRITPGGTFISQFGSTGGGPGQILAPEGIAVDAAGNVYIADTGNQRIVRFGDRADLGISVSASRAAVTVGEDLALTARVANTGPDRSQIVRVQFAPAGAAVVAATATQGGCAGAVCGLGTIPAGGAAAATATVRAQAPGALPMAVSVTGPTFDADVTNNSAGVTVAAQPAPAQPAVVAARPSLRVASAAFRARWARSRVKGALVLAVDTPRVARVAVELLRGSPRARVLERWTTRLPRAGRFTRRLRLPATLPPGVYEVRVRELGAPSGGALGPGSLRSRLAPPPEGVVSSAFISRGVGGRGVRRLARGPGLLFANFRLAAAARVPKRLRVAWFWSGRRGPVATKRVRPVAGSAVSPLRNRRGGLPPGRYRAVLRYGTKIVAVASVEIT